MSDNSRNKLVVLRVVQELAHAFGFRFHLIVVDDTEQMIASSGLTHADAFKALVKDLGMTLDDVAASPDQPDKQDLEQQQQDSLRQHEFGFSGKCQNKHCGVSYTSPEADTPCRGESAGG
jgi:hypothetical protein